MKNLYIVEANLGFLHYIEDLIFANLPEYKVIQHSYKANDFLMKIEKNPELLKKIDLLLVNPKLPDMNGIELIKKAYKYRRDLNIGILLNENIKNYFMNDISELGISNYLIYPAKGDSEIIEFITKSMGASDKKKASDYVSSFIDTSKKESPIKDSSPVSFGTDEFKLEGIDFKKFDFEHIDFSSERSSPQTSKDYKFDIEEEPEEPKEPDNTYDSEYEEDVQNIDISDNTGEDGDDSWDEKPRNESLFPPKPVSFERKPSPSENYNFSSFLSDEVSSSKKNQVQENQAKDEDLSVFRFGGELGEKDEVDEYLNSSKKEKIKQDILTKSNRISDVDDSVLDYRKKPQEPPVSFDEEDFPRTVDNHKKIDEIYSANKWGESDRVEPPSESERRRFEEVDTRGFRRFSKQLVAFYSSKGGVGKTTVLVNTAITLARYSKKRVCVIDFDLSNPNVHLHLGIFDPMYDLTSITQIKNEIDTRLIKKITTKYEDEKGNYLFDVIVGYDSESYLVERFTEKDVDKILTILLDLYDIVLVDTNPHYSDNAVSTVLKRATKIVFISAQEVSTLDGASKFLGLVSRLKIPMEKVMLVLNNYTNGHGSIHESRIEKILQTKVFVKIPYDFYTMRSAVNANNPVTLAHPNSLVSKSFLNIAKMIDTEIDISGGNKRGTFSFFK